MRRLSIGTAVFAAGIPIVGCKQPPPPTPVLPPAEKVTKEGKKKLGVALLGLGRYSTNELAPALQQTERCYLAGAISGHPDKLSQWQQQYSLPGKNLYSYDNLEQIADNKDIDIVYVVTPPAIHPEFAIRCAKAGKHVISEKPMATSVADCQAMIDACNANKVRLSIGYRLHFDPYLKELMRLQREKDFGDFMKITGDRGFVFGNHAWRIEKKLAGGGPMMDLGIYIVQGACMATGLTPVAVMAKERRKERPDVFTEVEETLDFTLEFPNGAVCTAVTSFNHSSDTFRAEGDKGWIDFRRSAFSYKVGEVVTSKGPLNYPTPPVPEGGKPSYQQAWQM
ncbi:MAG TPA: Gfo/Idh/MocA family oxidoreductase, partial [Desulfuromonadaceae bacterium]|nr:Gfo/Idh/MocA family oxidoreductase [Desulfuromonadaceae bacterium]